MSNRKPIPARRTWWLKWRWQNTTHPADRAACTASSWLLCPRVQGLGSGMGLGERALLGSGYPFVKTFLTCNIQGRPCCLQVGPAWHCVSVQIRRPLSPSLTPVCVWWGGGRLWFIAGCRQGIPVSWCPWGLSRRWQDPSNASIFS